MNRLKISDLRAALNEDVLAAAPLLLGAILVRGNRKARLVEVEAYRAEGDAGSHAYRGPTPRNRVMFARPGLAYVYFNYGCHWMLNVVAHPEGQAAAILVRAAEPLEGLEEFRSIRPKAKRDWDLLSGPGKLAAAFEIDAKDYGIDLFDPNSSLRLEPGSPPRDILTDVRVGLASGKGDQLPWRFVDSHALRFVSKPHPANR